MNGKIKIKVSNIAKRYRIGRSNNKNNTFMAKISSLLFYPYHKYKDLKKLSNFEDSYEADDIVWALKNISFEVSESEVLGIVGNNGAGKSTLLKILSRITSPTQGNVVLNGRVASLLEVGTGFHSDLTGRENIYLNGSILGMTKKEIDSKIQNIIDFSGFRVDKFIDTPVKRYSTGMRVRLAFSIAAHTDPEILLIDEVLAVGDQEFQNKCLQKMEDISSDSGRTIIFVSHDLQAIESLCDRVILLSDGEIKFNGKPKEAIIEYLKFENKKIDIHDVNYIDRIKRNINCTCKVLFSSIILEGNPHDNFNIKKGDPLKLKIDLKFKEIVEIDFILEILLNQNKTVYSSPRISLNNIEIKNKNEKSFMFVVDNFNLNEGIYYLKLALKSDNHKHDLISEGLPPLVVLTRKRFEKKSDGIVDFKYKIEKVY
jgi:lipopolysaccharide transport system ATP-binding protein